MAEEGVTVPTVEDTENKVLVIPEGKELLRVALLGVFVGVAIPLLAWIMQKYFVNPIFCRETTVGICAAADATTYYVSTVVLAVIAIALMANWQVFRPLLIAVAAAAALWGAQRYVPDMIAKSGIEYYALSAGLYGLMYVLFYWLMRLRSFAFSIILTVAAVVLLRWILLSA